MNSSQSSKVPKVSRSGGVDTGRCEGTRCQMCASD